MSFKRLTTSTTIAVVGSALAAWMAAGAIFGNRPTAPIVIKPPVVDRRGAELATEIARLHDRLRPDTPPHRGRNLFAFAAAPVKPKSKSTGEKSPALSERAVSVVAVPPPPPLKLSGIAEDTGSNGPVRTAIISGFNQLFLVKEGEVITNRFKVAKVSADVVELTDLLDGGTFRLALK